MKSTGMIRRIDDLGRVVIPKEIRRIMRIREGDPLEIYTNPSDNAVTFKRYTPHGEKDWNRAKKIVQKLFNDTFALFDRYGDLTIKAGITVPDSIDFENFDQCVTGCDYSEIRVCGEVAGYFVYGFEPTNVVRQAQINSAKNVLSVILDEDF